LKRSTDLVCVSLSVCVPCLSVTLCMCACVSLYSLDCNASLDEESFVATEEKHRPGVCLSVCVVFVVCVSATGV